MATAGRDNNRVPTIIGALETDGRTIVRILADETSHELFADDDTDGSDYGVLNGVRDENRVPVLMAVSSVDGVTPVEVYADLEGSLLVKSL